MPFVLVSAWFAGTPGISLRSRCVVFAFRALTGGDHRRAYFLLTRPMDSFRYFELDYVERNTKGLRLAKYLDVSSPRLTALSIVDRCSDLVADLINPIASDLAETVALAASLGLNDRIRPNCALIEEAGYAPESFDLITCISVMEHIPDDRAATAAIWHLLKPGGRFIITVPCARTTVDEYTNLDEYELFDKDQQGLVFWQRYYDAELLQDVIFSVMGNPTDSAIYGERKAGSYDNNVFQKRTDADYPYWREPLMMAQSYCSYEQLEALPGMAVIGMTFLKPARPQ